MWVGYGDARPTIKKWVWGMFVSDIRILKYIIRERGVKTYLSECYKNARKHDFNDISSYIELFYLNYI